MHLLLGICYLFLAVAFAERNSQESWDISRPVHSCREQWATTRESGARLTAIVASKGSTALAQTLESLMQQTQQNWLAIVVFDGVLSNSLYLNTSSSIPFFIQWIPDRVLLDGRFCFQSYDRREKKSSCSADLFNYGKSFASTEIMTYITEGDVLLSEHLQIELQNSSNPPHSNCYHLKPVVPKFIFTEVFSVIFRDNIQGLNQSIQAAIAKGCYPGTFSGLKSPIHVVFDAGGVLASPYYIQVQMEQREGFLFTDKYKRKLNNALQIWEFGYNRDQGMTNIPAVSPQIYFIPTMLTLKRNSNSVYRCPSKSAEESTQVYVEQLPINAYSFSFMIYRFGKYHHCEYKKKEKKWIYLFAKPSPCYQSNTTTDYCWQKNPLGVETNTSISGEAMDEKTFCSAVFNRKQPIDVLMFGKLDETYQNQREQLCDQLLNTGYQVICIQGVFFNYLNHLICSSKIVVVNHYYQNSALETHRIDPLLQAQKVVIATSSASVLDHFYAKAIPVVANKRLLSVTVKILRDYDRWLERTKYYEKVATFVSQMTTTLDPICYALSQLEAKIIAKQQQLAASDNPLGIGGEWEVKPPKSTKKKKKFFFLW